VCLSACHATAACTASVCRAYWHTSCQTPWAARVSFVNLSVKYARCGCSEFRQRAWPRLRCLPCSVEALLFISNMQQSRSNLLRCLEASLLSCGSVARCLLWHRADCVAHERAAEGVKGMGIWASLRVCLSNVCGLECASMSCALQLTTLLCCVVA
jgi:hypothetical protein